MVKMRRLWLRTGTDGHVDCTCGEPTAGKEGEKGARRVDAFSSMLFQHKVGGNVQLVGRPDSSLGLDGERCKTGGESERAAEWTQMKFV